MRKVFYATNTDLLRLNISVIDFTYTFFSCHVYCLVLLCVFSSCGGTAGGWLYTFLLICMANYDFRHVKHVSMNPFPVHLLMVNRNRKQMTRL